MIKTLLDASAFVGSSLWRTAAAAIVLTLLWWILAYSAFVNPLFLASPKEVFDFLRTVPSSKEHSEAIIATEKRVGWASAIILSIAIPLGLTLGYLAGFYSFLKGVLDFIRSIPPVVVLPIFLFIWKGTEEQVDRGRIALACFGTIPIVVFQIAEIVEKIPRERRDFARLLNAGYLFIIRRILFYETLPFVFVAARVAVSFSIIIIVVSEMVFSPQFGIGKRITVAQYSSQTQIVYAYALLIAMSGYTFNLIPALLE